MSDEQLFELCGTVSKKICLMRGKSVEDAMDVQTEAWLKCRGLTMRYPKSLVARAVNSVLVDGYRKHKETAELTEFNGGSVDPFDDSDYENEIERLANLLPNNWGEVFLLDHWGFTEGEGAEMLGLTVNSYGSKLFKLRKFLRNLHNGAGKAPF